VFQGALRGFDTEKKRGHGRSESGAISPYKKHQIILPGKKKDSRVSDRRKRKKGNNPQNGFLHWGAGDPSKPP